MINNKINKTYFIDFHLLVCFLSTNIFFITHVYGTYKLIKFSFQRIKDGRGAQPGTSCFSLLCPRKMSLNYLITNASTQITFVTFSGVSVICHNLVYVLLS